VNVNVTDAPSGINPKTFVGAKPHTHQTNLWHLHPAIAKSLVPLPNFVNWKWQLNERLRDAAGAATFIGCAYVVAILAANASIVPADDASRPAPQSPTRARCPGRRRAVFHSRR
jgi:hypothetical protein